MYRLEYYYPKLKNAIIRTTKINDIQVLNVLFDIYCMYVYVKLTNWWQEPVRAPVSTNRLFIKNDMPCGSFMVICSSRKAYNPCPYRTWLLWHCIIYLWHSGPMHHFTLCSNTKNVQYWVWSCSRQDCNLHKIWYKGTGSSFVQNINDFCPFSLSILQNSSSCCSCSTGFCVVLLRWCSSTTPWVASSFSEASSCRTTGGLSTALWAHSLLPFPPSFCDRAGLNTQLLWIQNWCNT